MTLAQLITNLSQAIITNGNNEITANVLRPLLIDIAEFTDQQVGDLTTLNSDEKSSVVGSINETITKLDELLIKIGASGTTLFVGSYDTFAELQTAHPTGVSGQYSLLGQDEFLSDGFFEYRWDANTSAWKKETVISNQDLVMKIYGDGFKGATPLKFYFEESDFLLEETDGGGIKITTKDGNVLTLGETSSTAYRGDRGKTAYDHSQANGNPHGTLAGEITDFASTVRSTVLTGLSVASSVIISATDSVLSALGRLQGQITALKGNVLEKDNTSTFTPTANYHPATKKYVDDNAGGTVVASAPISGDGSLGTPLTIANNAIGIGKIETGGGGQFLSYAPNGQLEKSTHFSYQDTGTTSLNCGYRWGSMYAFAGNGYTGTGITVSTVLAQRVVGGFARMLINRSTKPSVSGTGIFRELQSDPWVAGDQYELFLECVYVHPSVRASDVFHYQFRYTRTI